MKNVPVLETVAPADIAAPWRALAARSGNVFATYEWAETWWRHFGAGRERLTFLCRGTDGRPLAVLPLYVEAHGPLRVARFVGDDVGEELGPVCAPEDARAAGRALARIQAGADCPWDLFIGRSMSAARGWSRVLDAATVHRQGSPLVDLRQRSWDDFVAGRSKHFRHRVLGAERRLKRDHGLEYRRITGPEALPGALDALFHLHQELRAGRPSSFLRVASFHRDFARRALDAGWLRLRILELEGRPAAAVLDYSYEGLVRGYQLGMDPRWKHRMHVRLLIADAIRRACEEGALEYRLGRGGEAYKYQFADADPGVESLVKGRGPLGRPLAWALYRGRALRPTVRRLQRAAAASTAWPASPVQGRR